MQMAQPSPELLLTDFWMTWTSHCVGPNPSCLNSAQQAWPQNFPCAWACAETQTGSALGAFVGSVSDSETTSVRNGLGKK